MNKWLKISTIIGGVVAAVVLVGAVAFAFTPAPVRAQAAQQLMGRNFAAFHGQFGPRGQFGGPRGFGDGFGNRIDHDALLAEALGITVEELQAAKEQAHLAGIQQMVDEGYLTQPQADLMTARVKLNNYIDKDALTAKALGITVEELEAARDEGKPMFQLMQELGLDATAVRTAMNTAYQEAVQQAVTDGVITQDQADIFLSLPGGGFGPGRGHGRGPGGFGFGGPAEQFGGPGGPGRGGFGGPGEFGGQFGGQGGFGPGNFGGNF